MQFLGQEYHQNVVVCYNSLDRSKNSLEIQSLDIVETFSSLGVPRYLFLIPPLYSLEI